MGMEYFGCVLILGEDLGWETGGEGRALKGMGAGLEGKRYMGSIDIPEAESLPRGQVLYGSRAMFGC